MKRWNSRADWLAHPEPLEEPCDLTRASIIYFKSTCGAHRSLIAGSDWVLPVFGHAPTGPLKALKRFTCRCLQRVHLDGSWVSSQMDQHAANCAEFINVAPFASGHKITFQFERSAKAISQHPIFPVQIAQRGKCVSDVWCGGAATLINKYIIIFIIVVGAAASVQSMALWD